MSRLHNKEAAAECTIYRPDADGRLVAVEHLSADQQLDIALSRMSYDDSDYSMRCGEMGFRPGYAQGDMRGIRRGGAE